MPVMKQFRFLDWRIYTEAQGVFLEVLKLVKKLPREHRFDLGSQIVRSAFSAVLNIAEGSGKSSDRELNRYLDISMGSIYETKAAVDTFVLGGFCDQDDGERLTKLIKDLVSQVGGFKRKLKTN